MGKRAFAAYAFWAGIAALLVVPIVDGQGLQDWRAPRTSWGDPDLQGNFTNKYEQSTPLERPREFEGRRLEDVSGTELATILQQRDRQVIERPAGVGPYQFRDTLEVTRASRAWLVIDPPDGTIPALTPEARQRIGPYNPEVEVGIQGDPQFKATDGQQLRQRPLSWSRRSHLVGTVHHSWSTRVNDAAHPG